jgi:hypothetical protein
MHAWPNFSVITLDNDKLYFVSDASIRQLLKVHPKEI